jgi:hypothetical protein
LLALLAVLQAATPTHMTQIWEPQWLERPTAAEYQAVRPTSGPGATISGGARIRCDITADGRLAPCMVEKESPAAMGFGQAALTIAPKYRVATTTRAGAPIVDGFLRVTFDWRAPPAPPPEGARFVTDPVWVSSPTPDRAAKLYPDRAMRMEQTGWAVVQCAIAADGRLAQCAVIDEYPLDMGFADAALRLTAFYQAASKDAVGAPVAGALVRIPMNFNLPEY